MHVRIESESPTGVVAYVGRAFVASECLEKPLFVEKEVGAIHPVMLARLASSSWLAFERQRRIIKNVMYHTTG